MRWTLVVVALAACGESSRTPDAGGDGGGSADAYVPGMCDAPAPFGEGITPTRTLYVAPGATGGDGSMAAPFGTIEQAAADATPGTLIQLSAGMHATDQYVANLRGTEQAPIWISGTAGTIIDGGAQAIQLSRPAYVVLRDFEVRGQTANGINIDDGAEYTNELAAHHVSVINLRVHDVGGTGNQDCLKVSGVNDLYVYDSRFERCGGGASGSGIDHVGCHRSVIARNTFIAMSGNAVQAKGGSTDIDVRQNRMHDAGDRAINLGGSTGFEFFRPPLSTTAPNAEARRIRAFNNIITGTVAATPFAFVGCTDCLVANNLFSGSPRWLLRILQETVTQTPYTFEPARNGRVINNTFVWTTANFATHVNVGANTDAPSFTFAHNVWASGTPTLPVTETNGYVNMGTAFTDFPQDADASPGTSWCDGPERTGGMSLPEVTGYFEGTCRGSPHQVGPLPVGSCTL